MKYKKGFVYVIVVSRKRGQARKDTLFALTEHGFVIKEGDTFKMRAPIFEEWVNRFGDVV